MEIIEIGIRIVTLIGIICLCAATGLAIIRRSLNYDKAYKEFEAQKQRVGKKTNRRFRFGSFK